MHTEYKIFKNKHYLNHNCDPNFGFRALGIERKLASKHGHSAG